MSSECYIFEFSNEYSTRQDISIGTNILNTLTLLITFEKWLLELWYFIWIFFVNLLTITFDQFLKIIELIITSLKKYMSVYIADGHFFVTRFLYWYQNICTWDLVIFRSGHYRRHLFFTNRSCLVSPTLTLLKSYWTNYIEHNEIYFHV